jgi:predicted AlkP superfamily pyrophosphatase or phosphodiesterase
MKKLTIILLVVIVAIGLAFTVNNRNESAEKQTKIESLEELVLKPKLVVGIIVDQMRYDYLYRYWDQYSNDGFKRLVNDGFSCENHHFSYKPTETAPGHASVYSGTTPSVHGIIANDWWLKDEKRMTYCVEDLDVNSVGVNDSTEKRSPRNILVTNLSDEIKLNSIYKGKVIGISMKDRGAILPAGKMADAAYWFYPKEGGKFITSSHYMDKLPDWVNQFNNAKHTEKYINEGWELLYDLDHYTQSNSDDSPYEGDFYGLGLGGPPVLPYDIKAISDKAGDYTILKYIPASNNLLTDFVFAAIENEKLGEDDITDVLTISYSSPDEVGHIFGPHSVEIQDTYLKLDQSIASLLKKLDEKVGKGNYTLFLTADHGIPINTQELIDHNVNVNQFNRNDFKVYVKKIASKKYGFKVIEKMKNQQIYLNESLLKKNNINIKEVEDYIAKEILNFDGVYKSTTATLLQSGKFNEHLLFLQKGYNQKRSGHILYMLNPGWRKYEKKTGASHITPYTYDTHVPFLLYGNGIKNGQTHRRTLVEDIAPTITSLLHIQQPMGCTGNPVFEVLD